MYEKLKTQILPQLIPPNSRILVAVSGGPDSIALAHILWRYSHEVKGQNLSLVFTHVHHGVRQESDAEEKMVSDLAREWGIPCFVHRFDSKSYAKNTGQSFQTAAREWRYARWKEDMLRGKCTLLATAHHLGDQAETILYRLIRGSGTAGLAGIYPKKENVIRPLLSVSKEEILKYCQIEKLPYAIDQSNTEAVYVRNKIRLELLPVLERDYNPRVLEALGRLAELLRWDEEYLSAKVEEAWQHYALKSFTGRVGLTRKVFEEPPAMLSRLIRKAVGLVSGEPRGIGFSYVGQIMDSEGQVGWQQNLPGVIVHIDYEGIWFKKQDSSDGKEARRLSSHKVSYNEWFFWKDSKGQRWKLGIFSRDPRDLSSSSIERVGTEEVFFSRKKLEGIKESLVWRSRLPGDCMLVKGIGHKSLKKIFQEARIGAEDRENIPLLASGQEVLWIPGVKLGDYWQDQENEGMVGLLIPILDHVEEMNKKQTVDSL